ncbi:pogo transposable element derived with ZNF domain a isoform X2 [Anguilla anguilla]|uniref:pogo transposable element derived with ZNF domain a isoform X2 n=1 Tax=Anguilla anguilla TaxID=7936 RepID=UPI0015AE16C9|nr:pogo transposable element derived with ZNF domain a isoform X2 [Anguilla anguilla]
MADSNLFMECEEEELEPWQQVDHNIQEEDAAVADSSPAVAAMPYSLAAAPPVGSASAAPPHDPTMELPAFVSPVTMEVSSSGPSREALGPSPSAVPPSMPSLVPPALPQLKPGQQMILTQSPAPLGTVSLSQVLHSVPGASGVPSGNIAGQPIFITTSGFQVQNAVAGQSMLNPVGFLLNGQAFTFVPASGSQLFKPAIARALSQPANQQPATTTANQLAVTTLANQQAATMSASMQLETAAANLRTATTAANQLAVTTLANQQAETTSTSLQLETAAANQRMATTAANQKSFTIHIPATVTVKGSAPPTKMTATPPSSNAISGVSPFTKQKITEKRPSNPEVKKLIQAVNAASTSIAAQLKTLKVVKPNNKPPANGLPAAPPSKVKARPPKPVLGNKMCPQCGAQYRVVEALRGLLCLCSPEITRGLLAIGAAGAANVRPVLSPAASKAPASKATPRVAATACVALSPSRSPSRPDEGDSDTTGKLIMLVDDFYYGRDEGRGAPGGWDGGQQGPVQFRCLRCDKKLKNNVRLMNHLRHHIELEQQSGEVDTHSSCQHCYRRFTTPFRLQCHLESVHSQYESTTKCKICEWAFESEPVFLQHMKNTHSAGEMPYLCQVCEFRSSIYSDVFNHFRSQHKDTAKLLCPYCLKVFKTNGNYQHHYNRHQKKSVYHCDKCRLQFLCTRDKLEHKVSQHKSFCKPRQLQGLKPGTKVTIRAYAVENRTVGINWTAAVKPEPAAQAVTASATPSPAKKQPVAKRKPMCSMQELLTKFQEEREALGRQSCLECTFDIPDFPSHYPTYVSCSLCQYCTCCSRAYANHMINNHVSRKTSTKYLALYKAGPRWSELVCTACGFSTHVGDQMAKHLAKNSSHSSSYCTLKGPPVRGRGSQSRGDSAARALTGPDGGQAAQPPAVSSRVLPLAVPVHSERDGDDGDGGGRGEQDAGPGWEGANEEGAGPGAGALTVRQLRVLLFALCCGVPRAAQRFRAPPQLIWTWLLERERGLEPAGGAEGGAGGGAQGEEAERLAEWVLSRREQQLPVHEKNLFGKTSGLFQHRAGPRGVSCGWMVDFLLRWQLGIQATGTVSRPLPARAQARVRAFMELFRRRAREVPLRAVGTLDELSVFVNFDLLASPAAAPERRQLAFHLSGTGAPLCDVFLSALADGTLLPALVFPRRPVPGPLRPPRSVLLQPASEGPSASQQLRLWVSRAWQRGVADAGSHALLVMDGYRGHARADFQDALREAGTLAVVLPLGCAGRLQPLEMCAGPALRGFLEARWSQLAAEGGAGAGTTPGQMLQLVLDWLGEALGALAGLPELLRRSFRCSGLVPAEAGDGDPAETQSELVRALTEVLMGPKPANAVPPPPEEEEEEEKQEEGERGSVLDTSAESSAASPRWPPLTANPQALRSIFEKDSDAESFLGFDESEISAVLGQ